MSKQIFYLTAALLLVLVQPVGAATDSPWYFIPGGTSHHMSGSGWNENNWGAGLQYERQEEAGTTKYYLGGYYKNSKGGDTVYGGYGIRRNLNSHIGIGVTAYLLTGYGDFPILPAVLPAVIIGTEDVRVNVQYVPEIAGVTVETITFNLLVRIP